jgi:flagella basal body P-ring formation protein FlgA
LGNFIKTVFIALTFLVLLIGRVNAAVLNSQNIISEVKKSVKEQVKLITKGEVEVEINKIPYESIEVPKGAVEIKTSLNLKSFNPLTVARVEILVDGKKEISFGVPVKLYVYDKVWIAKDIIARNSTLTSSNLTLERKELGLITDTAARQDFSPGNYLAKKMFKPGDVIDTRYVETIPLIMKNSPISVIFKGSDITITIPAQSLEDGKIGDYIKVKSKELKKVYIGRVISTNTVQVNI